MNQHARPDRGSRTPDGLARIFDYFREVDLPQVDSRLYAHVCAGIARDPDLLALAALAPTTQPPPNLILGAVHYLLLLGEEHALRDFYPALAAGPVSDPQAAFPAFRDFCLQHRTRVENLIGTRLTQTNVVGRCSLLLPALARVFEDGGRRPLALIEIGPSAGLNLQWHRYRYAYRRPGERRVDVHWGDPDSPVAIDAEIRGERGLSRLPKGIPIAWRRGIDLHPVDTRDEDAVTWLRALVWPDHVGRQERLSEAIAIAQQDPPELLEGDAAVGLPAAIAAAPPDATLCVFGTFTLYQFAPDSLRSVLTGMQAASRSRPIDFVSAEGTGGQSSELVRTRYRDGERGTELLASCCPHGRWLEWLAGD